MVYGGKWSEEAGWEIGELTPERLVPLVTLLLLGPGSYSCPFMGITGLESTKRCSIKSWIRDVVLPTVMCMGSPRCTIIFVNIAIPFFALKKSGSSAEGVAKWPSGTCIPFPGGSVAACPRIRTWVQLNLGLRWWKAQIPWLGLLERSQSTPAAMHSSEWGSNLWPKRQGSIHHSQALLHCSPQRWQCFGKWIWAVVRSIAYTATKIPVVPSSAVPPS